MRKRHFYTKPFSTTTLLLLLGGIIVILGVFSIQNSSLSFTDFDVPTLMITVVTSGLLLGGGMLYAMKKFKEKKFQNTTLAMIDMMKGIEFEEYVSYLYQKMGYKTHRTPLSGDLGVDLVATKGDEKIAIQIKRYRGTVGRSAISDAVAGMAHYKCTRCAVVTNSFFTPLAIRLAYANKCQLINRNELIALFSKVRK